LSSERASGASFGGVERDRKSGGIGTGWFDRAVGGVVGVLVREHGGESTTPMTGPVADSVRGQFARMSDYLRPPIWLLTLALDGWPIVIGYGRPLHRQGRAEASPVLAGWRTGWSPFRRDPVKFYEALAGFRFAAETEGLRAR
jgi:hypothetical protein